MTIADKGVSEILRMLVPAEVPRFVPSPQGRIGRVCSCYDGDTVTLLCLMGGVPAQIALRILGVDAPERRGRGEAERNAATAVRDVVEALVLNKILPVRITGVDKGEPSDHAWDRPAKIKSWERRIQPFTQVPVKPWLRGVSACGCSLEPRSTRVRVPAV